MSIIIVINRVLVGFTFFALTACGGGASFDGGASHFSLNSSASSQGQGTGDLVQGKKLYEESCSGCHGADGNGGVSIDPGKQSYQYSTADYAQPLADYIQDWMPSPGAQICADECARDVAAYIRSWAGEISASSVNSSVATVISSLASSVVSSELSLSSQAVSSLVNSSFGDSVSSTSTNANTSSEFSSSASSEHSIGNEGDVLAGADIYQLRCVNCHGETGQGRIKIDPSREFYKHSQGEIEQSLVDYTSERMPPRGDKCADQCARDVAAFIRSWLIQETETALSYFPYGQHQFLKLAASDPLAYALGEQSLVGVSYQALTPEQFINRLILLTGLDYEFFQSSVDVNMSQVSNLLAEQFKSSYLDLSIIEFYRPLVQRVVEQLAINRYSGVLQCVQNNQLSLCEDELLDDFSVRVLGRSLLPHELKHYRIVFEESTYAGDVDAGVRVLIEALLTSPLFIFKK